MLIAILLGLAAIQTVFEFLARDLVRQKITTAQSYLNDSRVVSNPYLIAQKIEDLESLGVARCSIFKPADQRQDFINLSYKTGCEAQHSLLKELLFFKFKRAEAELAGIDGRKWTLTFRSIHSAHFRTGIWLTRLALIFFVMLINHFLNKTLALRLKAFEAERKLNLRLVSLAAQVAHDIRSPLAALGAATKSLALPADQRTLIDGAVGRMQAIANDLLHRYRAPGAEVEAKAEICPLSDLIEQVIAEKRIQHKDKPGVAIEFGSGDGIKAAVDPCEFQRIVSNLVNNAVEAIDKGGTVSVTLSALDGKALLSVKDDGKGIPPEILAKLGQKGETHGKAGGTGLGLYHAKQTVEEWGGTLATNSESGKGTAVTIELPRAERSAAPSVAVLLDDDPLVHMNWKTAAKAGGVELKACRTRAELEAVLPDLPKDTPIFMDSDLGEGVKGEDIAKTLRERGFTNLAMATGHDAVKFAHLPWLKVTGKEPPWTAV